VSRARSGAARARAARTASLLTLGAVLAVAFVLPLGYAALSSFKSPAEASQSPPTYLPRTWSWGNYERIAEYGAGLPQYLANTLLVAALTVALTVAVSVVAGYGLARLPFRGSTAVFGLIVVVLMVPYSTILIPLYVVLGWFGLQNSLVGLALVFTLFQLPFSVFMMRNSFSAVPRELEEAARVDGAGTVTLLTRVLLRLVLPGIVTVALFSFLAAWNEFLAPLIFLSDSDRYTLPVMLLNVRTGQLGAVDFGALQAGVTIAMLPCVVLFLALQRYYVHGLIAGAVKG
jgi:multiple sugar transport system permease protein